MLPQDITDKTILYAVLNWGLGHASRSIPLIQQLIDQDNYIDLGTDGIALSLLQKELPCLNRIGLASLNIDYRYQSMVLNMAIQLPKLIKSYKQDRKIIKSIQADKPYDIIISDHRYACYSQRSHSIFLGHQLSILSDETRKSHLASRLNAKMINAFDEVWVPDHSDKRLTGILSDNPLINIPTQYIGPLSRFKSLDKQANKRYKAAIILSGPEPRRTILETEIIAQLSRLAQEDFILVRGIEKGLNTPHKNIEVKTILKHEEISEILNHSECIISRAGYSTIMDVAALDMKALLIPTEGQTEQQFLSKHVNIDGITFTNEQELDIRNFLST